MSEQPQLLFLNLFPASIMEGQHRFYIFQEDLGIMPLLVLIPPRCLGSPSQAEMMSRQGLASAAWQGWRCSDIASLSTGMLPVLLC